MSHEKMQAFISKKGPHQVVTDRFTRGLVQAGTPALKRGASEENAMYDVIAPLIPLTHLQDCYSYSDTTTDYLKCGPWTKEHIRNHSSRRRPQSLSGIRENCDDLHPNVRRRTQGVARAVRVTGDKCAAEVWSLSELALKLQTQGRGYRNPCRVKIFLRDQRSIERMATIQGCKESSKHRQAAEEGGLPWQ
jgi:hypothetical protein